MCRNAKAPSPAADLSAWGAALAGVGRETDRPDAVGERNANLLGDGPLLDEHKLGVGPDRSRMRSDFPEYGFVPALEQRSKNR